MAMMCVLMSGRWACWVPSFARGSVLWADLQSWATASQHSSLADSSGSWLTSASTRPPSLTHLISLTRAAKQTEGIMQLIALPWELFFFQFSLSSFKKKKRHFGAWQEHTTILNTDLYLRAYHSLCLNRCIHPCFSLRCACRDMGMYI